MTDKQYRIRMEAILMNRKVFIASVKHRYQQAHVEWLGVIGLMETWEFIYDR